MLGHTLRRIGSSVEYWYLKYTAGVEESRAVMVDSFDDIYMAGADVTSTFTSPFIIKVSNQGLVDWENSWRGGSQNVSASIALLPSGSIVSVGTRSGTYSTGTYFKSGASGSHEFSKVFSGISNKNYSFWDVTTDSSGSVYLAGQAGTADDCLIIKHDGTSTNTITKSVSIDGVNEPMHTVESLTASVVGGGTSAGFASGACYLLNLDSTLLTISQQIKLVRPSFVANSRTYISNITTDGAGANYATMYYDGANINGSRTEQGEGFLIKYDNSGNVTWQRKMQNASYTLVPEGLALDSAGNVYVLIARNSSGTIRTVLQKYNSSGAVQWARLFTWSGENAADTDESSGGGGSDKFRVSKITIDSDDVMVIVGSTSTSKWSTILRLPSDGSLTGTYGDLTYGGSSIYDAIGGLTVSTPSLTTTSPTSTGVLSTDGSYVSWNDVYLNPTMDLRQPIV